MGYVIGDTVAKAWSRRWWRCCCDWVRTRNHGDGGRATATTIATTFSFITVAAAIVSSYMLIAALRKWKKRERSGLPPGPRGLPLLGSLPFLNPDLHRCFADLARTHGPVMSIRLGTRLCVVVSSPSAAKQVLGDQDAAFANRSPTAVAFTASYGGADLAWASYGPHWSMLRKVCSQGLLSTRVLEAAYPLRRREVRRAVADVRSKDGGPIDVRELMYMTALNVMTSMLWGSTLGAAERDGTAREFREVADAFLELLGAPNVSDYFPALARFDLQRVEKKVKGFMAWLDRIFEKIIDQRLKAAEEGGAAGESKDFLHVLLELMEKGDPRMPLKMVHVKALFQDLLGGGTDTTSTTAEWAMAELMNSPEAMRRAQEELDNAVGKDKIVEEAHLPALQYLDAVLKEVLRLHPVLPLLVPHCPSSSCTVNGYTVPKGTTVFVNAWAIHRDPCVWEDPSEFKPERFLIPDGRDNKFRYVPFGAGRRICVGMPLGEKMLKYTLASLLHSFDWKVGKETKLDLSEKLGFTLKKAEPLVAIPTPRLSNAVLYAEGI